MNNLKVKTICKGAVNWHIDRMWEMCSSNQEENARALYEEMREWIDNDVEHEVMYLELIEM